MSEEMSELDSGLKEIEKWLTHESKVYRATLSDELIKRLSDFSGTKILCGHCRRALDLGEEVIVINLISTFFGVNRHTVYCGKSCALKAVYD